MKKLIIIAVSLLLTKSVSGQIISTIAGSHAYGGGYTGNGGPATAAQLSEPSGIALDASGNLYIADAGNNVIRQVNTSGIITHFAGNIMGVDTCCGIGDGGLANIAQLKGQVGINIDHSGNMYISDVGNYRIRKINAANIITTIAGNGIEPSICDTLGDRGAATAAEIYCVGGIATDISGNVYFNADFRTTKKVNISSGIINTFSGYCYYGGLNFSGDGGLADTAILSNAVFGIAVDVHGNVYISDYNNDNIRKVNTSGIISTIAGVAGIVGYSGDGGSATAAKFAGPVGLALDAVGNLYIADQNNNVIRKIDTTGIITTVAGNVLAAHNSGDGGQATAAGLFNPYGVAIDALGNLYISDWGDNVIRKVTYNSATGIATLQNKVSEVNIYPNPTTGEITINGSAVSVIEVYNSMGQLLKEVEKTNRISITEYPVGLYFILLFNETGQLLQQSKIIKE